MTAVPRISGRKRHPRGLAPAREILQNVARRGGERPMRVPVEPHDPVFPGPAQPRQQLVVDRSEEFETARAPRRDENLTTHGGVLTSSHRLVDGLSEGWPLIKG